ncbi:AMP-binding protein (plasmid) [Tistrella mobilis]|uniref:class I adenylate-forming enzyme family protein n=1 Tax=Tistrella mobilis TaxID=171437 RepID=UPI003555C777
MSATTCGPLYRDLIDQGARWHGPRTAIEFEGQSLTFTEVDQLSARLANAFHAAGLGHRTRVALLLDNGLMSVPVDFACVRAGIDRVPLNSRLSLREHAHMLRETRVGALVYGPELAGRAAELAAELPDLTLLGLGTTEGGGSDIVAAAADQPTTPPAIRVEADDVVLTLFTSGTTGTLKAAQHTQASYAAICRNVLLNLLPAGPDDAMLHAASLIHASGVFVLPFWLRGGRTVIMRGFEPDAYLARIVEDGITAINMVPTMLGMLLDRPGAAAVADSRLKTIIYGASPMPRPVIERAMAMWGQHRFWQYYGQTECPLTISVLRPEDHVPELLGAAGRPALDVELRIVDAAGQDVPAGEPGEIAVRAPQRMKGYLDAPALNAETLLPEGWMRTRDIGRICDRGYLHLLDRTSDMIVTGGYNVYPREVEDVLAAHPAVAECAVIGLSDPQWVEAVTAVVALRPDHRARAAADPDAFTEELRSFAGERLAGYKKPRRVIVVDTIPKTAVGKLNRKALRDTHRAG